MVEQVLNEILEKQMTDVQQKFHNLCLAKGNEGVSVVSGILGFNYEYNGKGIIDAYNVEIYIPDNFPKDIPRTRSVDRKVSESFHTYPKDRTLCLGFPLAEKLTFHENPSLVGYIENLLVPYLFSHSYLQEYGELPYGDLEHGGKGKLDYYRDLFSVEDDLTSLKFLSFLADGKYKGHYPCPCGSNLRLRKCHGPLLLRINAHHSAREFMSDFYDVFMHLKENITNTRVLTQYIPNSIKTSRSKRRRKLHRRNI